MSITTGTEYTFFLSVHGTFFNLDEVLGHKAILNKFKIIENIPCMFSDHHGVKLETKNSKLQKTYKHLEAEGNATE